MRTSKITPFLWFDDKAEEAMRLYVSIFKNSKVLSVTPGPNGNALTVQFELEGQPIMGLNAGPMFKFTEAFSFFVSCADQAEVDDLCDARFAERLDFVVVGQRPDVDAAGARAQRDLRCRQQAIGGDRMGMQVNVHRKHSDQTHARNVSISAASCSGWSCWSMWPALSIEASDRCLKCDRRSR